MYIKHFRLNGRPYTQGPDPQFCVPNQTVDTTATRLAEVMAGRGAAAVVSGGPGVGKTALVNHAAAIAGDDATIAWADIRQLEPETLLDQLLLGLGMDAGDGSGALSAHRLRVAVSEQNRAGRSVTAAIDVGTVTAERAKRLLRLAHLIGNSSVGLNVVLMGPHTLHKVLDVPGMIHLRQRVAVRYRVRPLSEDETRNYIGEGLSRVGGDPGGMLDDEVPGLVYRYVAGVPRLINTMMDMALTEAALRQSPRVTADAVGQVAQGLGWRTLGGKAPGPRPKATQPPAKPAAPKQNEVPPKFVLDENAAPAPKAPEPKERAPELTTTVDGALAAAAAAQPEAAAESQEPQAEPAKFESPIPGMGLPGVPDMDPEDTSATGMLRLEDLDERFAEHVFSEE
ncbi:MAG: hypothetical protein JSV45_02660 [Chromatiales bacterium]|nr:MAG: hypothetical protein JSV45_02660 [Chromatiales bacterium]